MALGEESAAAHQQWRSLSIYQKFEYVVVLILIGLIAIIVLLALWSLALKVLSSVVAATTLDPTDHAVFQSVFGMIFTVIIALEFKRSLLLVTARQETVVQVRAVILIAM